MLQWNFSQNTKPFIHENSSEFVVCEISAMLSRGDELTPLSLDKMAAISQTTYTDWNHVSAKVKPKYNCNVVSMSLKLNIEK